MSFGPSEPGEKRRKQISELTWSFPEMATGIKCGLLKHNLVH